MEGNWSGADGKFKYGYNGKEWNDDFGLGWNDYGSRWYDPAIGRFPSVDPIIEKFPHATPYNYAENSPVSNIDLWGLQKYHFTRLQNSDGSNYLRLTGVSNFYETKPVSFHPFRSSGYYTYETKINNDHQEYEVTQSIVKNESTRLNNDVFGITNDITNTYKTLDDAINAPDSDFKQNKVDGFFERMLAYGTLGMTTEVNGGKNLLSLVKKDERIFKLATETFQGNNLLSKSANNLIKQLIAGNMNPGINTKELFKGIFESRARDGARVYFREAGETIEILGYSNKHNQQQVIDRLEKIYAH